MMDGEPRYQFWRPIQPVERQPIPEGAMYESLGKWYPRSGIRFHDVDFAYNWRAPVEVVPIDLAVDAIMQNRAITKGWRATGQPFVCIKGENLIADTLPELRELVIAKLRQLSQEKT